MNAAETFRANVKAEMQRRGISITKLSEMVGIPRSNMSRILSGKERVTIDRGERLVNALGINWLTFWTLGLPQPVNDRSEVVPP